MWCGSFLGWLKPDFIAALHFVPPLVPIMLLCRMKCSSSMVPLKLVFMALPHFLSSVVRIAAALQDVVWRVGSSFLGLLKPDFMALGHYSLYLVCIGTALQDLVWQSYCPAQARFHGSALLVISCALQDVVWRVGSSFLGPLKPDFMAVTMSSPDLYGPFWVATTLIFVTAGAWFGSHNGCEWQVVSVACGV
jgi:hypothetical protein